METNYPLKLWVYTFCYNEEKILPYVIEYWKQYATKVIVYDNGSTDNSLKILSQYSWIEVREFDTENTFDPEKISQYKSFCYADAIGKADYVMVCDIDEVLLPSENLFPELVLAKKDNVQLFQTKYYEIINNELNPNYDSLIHTIDGYYAYSNSNIHKAIIFDPQIKISFGPNSLTYSTNKNYKTESIIVFHLKLFNSNIFTERQKHLISRSNKNQDLYYGNEKNLGTRLSYFKLLFQYKYKFDKNENYITISNDIFSISNSSFYDIPWLSTNINHNTNSNNKSCIIGIPIYKEHLSDNEKASLNQICSIIKDSYEICLICSEDISLDEYNAISEKNNVKLSTLYCAKQYFAGTKEYSFMLETTEFYKCFSEYQYLMIYQLDGWIFKNDLQKFIELDYDYYGSPWKLGSFGFNDDTVGNGGVSLRKVSKFIEACQKFESDDFKKQYVDKEDLFFCKTMQSKIGLKKAPVRISAGFAITSNPPYFRYKYIDKQLPMCVHAFDKYMQYWDNDIKIEKGDNKENNGMSEVKPEKHDYKTRLELIKMRLNKTPIKPEQINNQTIKNGEQKEKRKMGNSYSDFLKAYFGTKETKNQEEKQKVAVKPQVTAEPAVLVKQEGKQEIIDPNQHINILIVHYNTPYLTECLIKSINKFVGYNCTIYIFDNSDKAPFTYRQNNIKIFDNTKGQIIDFEKELKNYQHRPEASNMFASYKHCISVDTCFDLINDNFILLDSDILLTQNITQLFDVNYIFKAETEKNMVNIERIMPYCCFINVKKCKEMNIRFFDKNHMHGISNGSGNYYDTGAAFFMYAKKYKYKLIKLDNYIIHYKGASWNPNYKNNIKYHGNLTPEQWVEKYKKYWNMNNNKVIYTCITGSYEKIVDPTYIQPDFDYICFTDNLNQTSKVWKFREIPEELQKYSKVKQQRLIKICPHKYLSEYDESLWVDGSIDILSDVNKFIDTYCNIKDKSVYIRRHPARKCIYVEANTCISMKKDNSANINPQIEKYKKENFPANFGLVETGYIYRKHHNPYCVKLMNLWANELINGSHRDQLSFNYALWKIGDSGFQYLDTKLLNCEYFKWYPHHNRK